MCSAQLAYAAHALALCQHMLRILQHFDSSHCAYGSKLLAHTAHAVAKSCKNGFLQAYAAHAVANCQRMLRIRQQFASVCCSYGSNLPAYTAHIVKYSVLCQSMLMRQPMASVCCACGSPLLAYAANAVAICQRRRRMRQQKHNGRNSPICKNSKKIYFIPKVPYLQRLHDKKIIKIQVIKISHVRTFNCVMRNPPNYFGQNCARDIQNKIICVLQTSFCEHRFQSLQKFFLGKFLNTVFILMQKMPFIAK